MITGFSDGALEPGAPHNGYAVCAYVIFKGVVSGTKGANRPKPLKAQHGYIGRFADGFSHNVAEWRALLAAMKWCQKFCDPNEKIELRTDSQIVERAVNGFCRNTMKHLMPYKVEGQKILVAMPHMRVVWVKREEVYVADELTRVALRKVRSK